MELDKKGQGAMEYLMTYGWAIMVVMIVGVVLWQMGVFSGFGCNTSAKDFEAVKPLNPSEVTVDTNGNMSATFINTAGSTITITDADWNISAPDTGTCQLTARTSTGSAVDLASNNLAVDAGTTFRIYCASNPADFSATSGQSYTGQASIDYEMNVGGFQSAKTETGSIQGCIAQ